jgi:hypothetical protein
MHPVTGAAGGGAGIMEAAGVGPEEEDVDVEGEEIGEFMLEAYAGIPDGGNDCDDDDVPLIAAPHLLRPSDVARRDLTSKYRGVSAVRKNGVMTGWQARLKRRYLGKFDSELEAAAAYDAAARIDMPEWYNGSRTLKATGASDRSPESLLLSGAREVTTRTEQSTPPAELSMEPSMPDDDEESSSFLLTSVEPQEPGSGDVDWTVDWNAGQQQQQQQHQQQRRLPPKAVVLHDLLRAEEPPREGAGGGGGGLAAGLMTLMPCYPNTKHAGQTASLVGDGVGGAMKQGKAWIQVRLETGPDAGTVLSWRRSNVRDAASQARKQAQQEKARLAAERSALLARRRQATACITAAAAALKLRHAEERRQQKQLFWEETKGAAQQQAAMQRRLSGERKEAWRHQHHRLSQQHAVEVHGLARQQAAQLAQMPQQQASMLGARMAEELARSEDPERLYEQYVRQLDILQRRHDAQRAHVQQLQALEQRQAKQSERLQSQEKLQTRQWQEHDSTQTSLRQDGLRAEHKAQLSMMAQRHAADWEAHKPSAVAKMAAMDAIVPSARLPAAAAAAAAAAATTTVPSSLKKRASKAGGTLSAYHVFFKATFDVLKAQAMAPLLPGAKCPTNEIVCEIGKRWRALGAHEKAEYAAQVQVQQREQQRRQEQQKQRRREQQKQRQEEQCSQYRGVSMCSNGVRWRAQIQCGGRRRHLGTFDTEEEAAATYARAARDKCGHDAVGTEEQEAAVRATAAVNSGAVGPPKKRRTSSGVITAMVRALRADLAVGGAANPRRPAGGHARRALGKALAALQALGALAAATLMEYGREEEEEEEEHYHHDHQQQQHHHHHHHQQQRPMQQQRRASIPDSLRPPYSLTGASSAGLVLLMPSYPSTNHVGEIARLIGSDGICGGKNSQGKAWVKVRLESGPSTGLVLRWRRGHIRCLATDARRAQRAQKLQAGQRDEAGARAGADAELAQLARAPAPAASLVFDAPSHMVSPTGIASDRLQSQCGGAVCEGDQVEVEVVVEEEVEVEAVVDEEESAVTSRASAGHGSSGSDRGSERGSEPGAGSPLTQKRARDTAEAATVSAKRRQPQPREEIRPIFSMVAALQDFNGARDPCPSGLSASGYSGEQLSCCTSTSTQSG